LYEYEDFSDSVTRLILEFELSRLSNSCEVNKKNKARVAHFRVRVSNISKPLSLK
jgi:hypothetical protein